MLGAMKRLWLAVAVLSFLVACSPLGGPAFTVDRAAVVLGSNSSTTIVMRNGTNRSLSWEASADATWLIVVPNQGTLQPLGSAEVLLFVDRSESVSGSNPFERTPGTSLASVGFTSEEGDVAVDVSASVQVEPTDDACAAATASATALPVDPMSGYGFADTGTGPAPERPQIDGPITHVLVRYRSGSGAASSAAGEVARDVSRVASEVARAYGISKRKPGPGRGVEVVAVPTGMTSEALVRQLKADPRVAHAELDRALYPLQAFPNDPSLGRQWAPCRFGVPQAWEFWTGVALTGTDAPKSTIAVIDSGVDLDHPDLQARMLPGFDFCPLTTTSPSGCSEATPAAGGGHGTDAHGTHVAGIAAAAGNNATGIAGIAFGGPRILPVKVFDDSGRITAISAVACGIYWAIGSTDPDEICGATANPNPAMILNLSLGGPGTSQILDDVVADATSRGALVLAAAGNCCSRSFERAYQGVYTPANAPDAIAIGSVNSNFERSSFSFFGTLGRPSVDLMAPGGFLMADGSTIYSTVPTESGSAYRELGGTSMAAPFVAGVAALVWSRQPSMSRLEVFEHIRDTAYLPTGWDPDEYGAGIVCADRAVGALTQCGMN